MYEDLAGRERTGRLVVQPSLAAGTNMRFSDLNTTARAAPKRELRRGNYAMMFTKYHWMGRALDLDMAAGLVSVTFFSKTKLKEEKVVFYFPVKCRLL